MALAFVGGAVIAALVVVALLAARNGGDDGELTDPVTPAPTTEPAPVTEPAPTTAPAESEDALRPGPFDGPGTEIVNEQRGWAIVVDPTWTEAPGGFTEAMWYTGAASDPTADNVNLLIEELGARMPPSLEAYVDASLAGLETVLPDAEVLRRETLVQDDGTRHAVLEYAVEYEGLSLTILQVITATSERGAAATFTTMSGDPGAAIAAVEPYLLTLRLR